MALLESERVLLGGKVVVRVAMLMRKKRKRGVLGSFVLSAHVQVMHRQSWKRNERKVVLCGRKVDNGRLEVVVRQLVTCFELSRPSPW